MFWLNQTFARLNGGQINQITSRLPSLLGSASTLYVTSRLGILLWGGLSGWTAPLLLATSFLFWKTTGMGQMDALLLGLQFSAFGLLVFSQKHEGHSKTGMQILAYLFMGLAILTKGPVGLLIPYGSWICFTGFGGKRKQLRAGHLLWGPLLALLPAALWLGSMLLWEPPPPGFLDELLLKQNLGRMDGTFAQGHLRPFWYFLLYIPLDFLPWTFLLPAVATSLLKDSLRRPQQRALLSWLLFVVLFFSLSATKRNLYILSAYPVLALLTAGAFERRPALEPTRMFQNSLRVLGGFFVITGLLLSIAAPLDRILGVESPLDLRMLRPCGLILFGTGLGLLRTQVAITSRSLLTLSGGMGLALLAFSLWVYPVLNTLKVPYELRKIAAEHAPEARELLLYRMHGEIQALTAGLRGREIQTPELLETALREPGPHLLVVDSRTWSDIEALLVSRKHQWGEYRMGSKTLRWVQFSANAES